METGDKKANMAATKRQILQKDVKTEKYVI